MRFKTLKHRTIPDTFGHSVTLSDDNVVIGTCDMPLLQPMTATMELMQKYAEKVGWKDYLEQLKDYDLVEVEVTVVETNLQNTKDPPDEKG